MTIAPTPDITQNINARQSAALLSREVHQQQMQEVRRGWGRQAFREAIEPVARAMRQRRIYLAMRRNNLTTASLAFARSAAEANIGGVRVAAFRGWGEANRGGLAEAQQVHNTTQNALREIAQGRTPEATAQEAQRIAQIIRQNGGERITGEISRQIIDPLLSDPNLAPRFAQADQAERERMIADRVADYRANRPNQPQDQVLEQILNNNQQLVAIVKELMPFAASHEAGLRALDAIIVQQMAASRHINLYRMQATEAWMRGTGFLKYPVVIGLTAFAAPFTGGASLGVSLALGLWTNLHSINYDELIYAIDRARSVTPLTDRSRANLLSIVTGGLALENVTKVQKWRAAFARSLTNTVAGGAAGWGLRLILENTGAGEVVGHALGRAAEMVRNTGPGKAVEEVIQHVRGMFGMDKPAAVAAGTAYQHTILESASSKEILPPGLKGVHEININGHEVALNNNMLPQNVKDYLTAHHLTGEWVSDPAHSGSVYYIGYDNQGHVMQLMQGWSDSANAATGLHHFDLEMTSVAGKAADGNSWYTEIGTNGQVDWGQLHGIATENFNYTDLTTGQLGDRIEVVNGIGMHLTDTEFATNTEIYINGLHGSLSPLLDHLPPSEASHFFVMYDSHTGAEYLAYVKPDGTVTFYNAHDILATFNNLSSYQGHLSSLPSSLQEIIKANHINLANPQLDSDQSLLAVLNDHNSHIGSLSSSGTAIQNVPPVLVRPGLFDTPGAVQHTLNSGPLNPHDTNYVDLKIIDNMSPLSRGGLPITGTPARLSVNPFLAGGGILGAVSASSEILRRATEGRNQRVAQVARLLRPFGWAAEEGFPLPFMRGRNRIRPVGTLDVAEVLRGVHRVRDENGNLLTNEEARRRLAEALGAAYTPAALGRGIVGRARNANRARIHLARALVNHGFTKRDIQWAFLRARNADGSYTLASLQRAMQAPAWSTLMQGDSTTNPLANAAMWDNFLTSGNGTDALRWMYRNPVVEGGGFLGNNLGARFGQPHLLRGPRIGGPRPHPDIVQYNVSRALGDAIAPMGNNNNNFMGAGAYTAGIQSIQQAQNNLEALMALDKLVPPGAGRNGWEVVFNRGSEQGAGIADNQQLVRTSLLALANEGRFDFAVRDGTFADRAAIIVELQNVVNDPYAFMDRIVGRHNVRPERTSNPAKYLNIDTPMVLERLRQAGWVNNNYAQLNQLATEAVLRELFPLEATQPYGSYGVYGRGGTNTGYNGSRITRTRSGLGRQSQTPANIALGVQPNTPSQPLPASIHIDTPEAQQALDEVTLSIRDETNTNLAPEERRALIHVIQQFAGSQEVRDAAAAGGMTQEQAIETAGRMTEWMQAHRNDLAIHAEDSALDQQLVQEIQDTIVLYTNESEANARNEALAIARFLNENADALDINQGDREMNIAAVVELYTQITSALAGEVEVAPERGEARFDIQVAAESRGSNEPAEPNQDRVISEAEMEELGMIGVFDGMGGYNGSERAAEIGRDTFVQEVREARQRKPDGQLTIAEARQALAAAYRKSVASIKVEAVGVLEHMGSTVSVGVIALNDQGQQQMVTLIIGDSRLWFELPDGTVQSTIDHSTVYDIFSLGRHDDQLMHLFNNAIDEIPNPKDYNSLSSDIRDQIQQQYHRFISDTTSRETGTSGVTETNKAFIMRVFNLTDQEAEDPAIIFTKLWSERNKIIYSLSAREMNNIEVLIDDHWPDDVVKVVATSDGVHDVARASEIARAIHAGTTAEDVLQGIHDEVDVYFRPARDQRSGRVKIGGEGDDGESIAVLQFQAATPVPPAPPNNTPVPPISPIDNHEATPPVPPIEHTRVLANGNIAEVMTLLMQDITHLPDNEQYTLSASPEVVQQLLDNFNGRRGEFTLPANIETVGGKTCEVTVSNVGTVAPSGTNLSLNGINLNIVVRDVNIATIRDYEFKPMINITLVQDGDTVRVGPYTIGGDFGQLDTLKNVPIVGGKAKAAIEKIKDGIGEQINNYGSHIMTTIQAQLDALGVNVELTQIRISPQGLQLAVRKKPASA